MLDCKGCIKKDVCGKTKLIQSLFEELSLYQAYQNILKNGIKMSASCENFVQENKILRGEK